MDTNPDLSTAATPIATGASPSRLAVGETRLEDAVVNTTTRRVHRFSINHPLAYYLLAFVIAGGLISGFTASTYVWWVNYPIDVVTAFYQMLIGGVCGGIVGVLLAALYKRSMASLAR